MKEKITLNEAVCEAITTALIRLMAKKDFSEISVTEIVKLAGVGRTSFYRNFSDKRDVLLKHIDALFDVSESPENPYSRENIRAFLISRYKLCRENKDFLDVLKKNDMLYLLYRRTNSLAVSGTRAFDIFRDKYQTVFYSSASVGMIIQWFSDGFYKSDAELADIYLDLMRTGIK